MKGILRPVLLFLALMSIGQSAYAQAYQKLSFTINRAKLGMENAQYVIDVSQWPQSVTSWCEGEKLYDLPFCGGIKDDDPSGWVEKTVYFKAGSLSVSKIEQKQSGKLLRTHRVDYYPDRKRIKAKFKSKNAAGATLFGSNIIASSAIELVTLESLLLGRLLAKPGLSAEHNLHWIEPKRSKRMALVGQGTHQTVQAGAYPQVKAAKLAVNQMNPGTHQQTPMFAVFFNEQGFPLQVQANSGNWVLGLIEVDVLGQPTKKVGQLWK